MQLILHGEVKCVSEMEGDISFEGLNKRFCKHCIKHYMRKVYYNLLFSIFNEWYFRIWCWVFLVFVYLYLKDYKLLLGLVLQDYKMSQVQVPAEFFPAKFFCYWCLTVYINETFNANIREYSRNFKGNFIQQNDDGTSSQRSNGAKTKQICSLLISFRVFFW